MSDRLDLDLFQEKYEERNNDARVEIYAVLEISGGRLFERLMEKLAYLARWETGFDPE